MNIEVIDVCIAILNLAHTDKQGYTGGKKFNTMYLTYFFNLCTF